MYKLFIFSDRSHQFNQWSERVTGVLTLPASCRSCRGVRHWTDAHLPHGALRRESVEQVETAGEDLSGGKTIRVFHK